MVIVEFSKFGDLHAYSVQFGSPQIIFVVISDKKHGFLSRNLLEFSVSTERIFSSLIQVLWDLNFAPS